MGTQSKFHKRLSHVKYSTVGRYELDEIATAISILERPREDTPTPLSTLVERIVSNERKNISTDTGDMRTLLTYETDETDESPQLTNGLQNKIKTTRSDRRWAKRVLRAEVRSILRRTQPPTWTELQISLVKRYSHLIPMNPKLWQLMTPSAPDEDYVPEEYMTA